MNYRMCVSACLAVMAGLVAATTVAAQATDDLRASLFTAADRALAAANQAKASLLAPAAYAEGAEAYRQAESILAGGGAIERIQARLEDALDAFTEARVGAERSEQALAPAWAARADAQQAEAERYAADQWQKAETFFYQAAVRASQKKKAERQHERALAAYREAELEAIQANYLNETRALLEQAEDLDAHKLAAVSFGQARTQLADAEAALVEDRYDTDRPRNLARQAKHAALHAIYVAKLEHAIDDDELTVERILLDWEAGIGVLANLVDTPVYFDEGHNAPVAKIAEQVQATQQRERMLQDEVAEMRARLSSLEADNASLQAKLGGESEAVARLNDTLARQERRRAKLEAVEKMFLPAEAQVLREGEKVILRLVGLNFGSGSAKLGPEHDGVLNKLSDALAQFPESDLIVEGHTDSYGSDEANQVLSRQRAESVTAYLLQRLNLSPVKVTPVGYGETRPVANNETPEGRKKNRRIDIVLYPRW